MFRSVVPGLNWQWINTYRWDQECKVFFSKDNTVRRNFNRCLLPGDDEVYQPRGNLNVWSTPGNGENMMMRAGYPKGTSEGIVSPLRWCYQWQLREGGARFEPTEALGRHPPASHVHFATRSLKRIPQVFLSVQCPTLWSADPVCFHGTEVITLWPCRVKRWNQMSEGLQGMFNVTIGHKPAY